MRKFAIIMVILIGAVLVLAAQSPNVSAADEVQQIKVGAETLYVPKSWIGFDSVFGAGTAGGSEIKLPQSGTVEVAQMAMRPNAQWQSYRPWQSLSLGSLPTFIRIGYGVALPALVGKAKEKTADRYKQLFKKVETLTPDKYGFVRIATGFANPGEPPQWERFLYKGYQDQFGEPLIVDSSNVKGVHSVVGLHAQLDLSVTYFFEKEEFPESTWWDLYKRVRVFLDYLQKLK
jgi:hypothetical protein